MGQMRRREFLALSIAVAVPWPLAARAQVATMPVVGFLNGGSAEGYARLAAAFREGLKEAGFVDGKNVVIEYRWADGQFDRLPALASDLVRRKVRVLAATSTPAALAAKATTTTIPIVFTTSSDPVNLKLVTGLSGSSGNVTGATQLNVEVAPKRLELLHELNPAAKDIGLLINPTNPTAQVQARELQRVARTLALQLHVVHASTERDLETAFRTLVQLRAGGLVIGSADPFFTGRTKQLAALALRYALPTVYQYPEFTGAGGLMSYGGSISDTYHLAGVYTGRILKGEMPADLPVQQSTKVELVINLKTAKALGLSVPLSLLGRADAVVE
jgi:putative ABC transport system substrate-binding protein